MADGGSIRYIPILKARMGELTALKFMEDGAPVPTDVMPLIEVVEGDFTGDYADRARQYDRVIAKVAPAWPAGRPRVAIDTLNVEVDLMDDVELGEMPPPEPVMPELLQRLRVLDIRAVPVVRLSDSQALKAAITPMLDWFEPGVCLRIGGEDLDDQIVPLDQAVEDLLRELRLHPRDVDLVLDFGAIVDDNTLAMASRLARFVLPALDREPWRSFALGAGAFPVNLSEVSPFVVSEIPRRDKQLWMQLQQLRLRHGLDFADYAVTHPLLQTGVAFAAPPQIRYTSDAHWLVAKGRRTERRGHRQFFDLCDRIRRERPAEIAPAGRTWGDFEFHVAAGKAGTEGDKPGNASTWRAIATSHHVGQVLHGLRTRGEP